MYEGLKGGNIVERTGVERSGSQFGKQERDKRNPNLNEHSIVGACKPSSSLEGLVITAVLQEMESFSHKLV